MGSFTTIPPEAFLKVQNDECDAEKDDDADEASSASPWKACPKPNSGMAEKRGQKDGVDYGEYNERKKQKLREGQGNAVGIFSGICIWIDGLTKVSGKELHKTVQERGGKWEQHMDFKRVTHVISNQLTKAKVDMYRKRKDPPHVVREEWIMESAAKNRLLDVGAYMLMSSSSSLAMSNFVSSTPRASSNGEACGEDKSQAHLSSISNSSSSIGSSSSNNNNNNGLSGDWNDHMEWIRSEIRQGKGKLAIGARGGHEAWQRKEQERKGKGDQGLDGPCIHVCVSINDFLLRSASASLPNPMSTERYSDSPVAVVATKSPITTNPACSAEALLSHQANQRSSPGIVVYANPQGEAAGVAYGMTLKDLARIQPSSSSDVTVLPIDVKACMDLHHRLVRAVEDLGIVDQVGFGGDVSLRLDDDAKNGMPVMSSVKEIWARCKGLGSLSVGIGRSGGEACLWKEEAKDEGQVRDIVLSWMEQEGIDMDEEANAQAGVQRLVSEQEQEQDGISTGIRTELASLRMRVGLESGSKDNASGTRQRAAEYILPTMSQVDVGFLDELPKSIKQEQVRYIQAAKAAKDRGGLGGSGVCRGPNQGGSSKAKVGARRGGRGGAAKASKKLFGGRAGVAGSGSGVVKVREQQAHELFTASGLVSDSDAVCEFAGMAGGLKKDDGAGRVARGQADESSSVVCGDYGSLRKSILDWLDQQDRPAQLHSRLVSAILLRSIKVERRLDLARSLMSLFNRIATHKPEWGWVFLTAVAEGQEAVFNLWGSHILI